MIYEHVLTDAFKLPVGLGLEEREERRNRMVVNWVKRKKKHEN